MSLGLPPLPPRDPRDRAACPATGTPSSPERTPGASDSDPVENGSGAPRRAGRALPPGTPTGPDGRRRPVSAGKTDQPRRVARTDRLTTAWMAAALAVMAAGLAARGLLPQPLWTMIHVVTLGVLSNAILQWSWYFARALLHLPPGDRRAGRDNAIRIVVFNIVLVVLVASMWTAWLPGTIVGAAGVGAVVAWHGLALLRAARTRLASRFAVVIRFYAAASGFLVAGCALAGLLTVAMFDGGAPARLLDARDGLTLAHALVNVAGWIGLTMAGTLVTLGPTMLRTRMADGAVPAAVTALPVLCAGVLGAATAAAFDWMPGVAGGLGAYAAALAACIGAPLVRAALGKAPRSVATWTAAAGLAWVVLGLLDLAVVALRVPDATAFRDAHLAWLPVLGAGGLVQIFVGALCYLMPVVIGGGPSAVRAGIAELERGAALRLTARNAALAVLAVLASLPAAGAAGIAGVAGVAGTLGPGTVEAGSVVVGAASAPLVPSLLVPVLWGVVLATFAAELFLFARAGIVQSRARRAAPLTPGSLR